MLFWAFMLIMTLLVPLIMIVFGTRFEKNAPKEINSVFGYRTTMSMKNKETWQFAHKYIGKLWKKCGWLFLLISAAVIIVSFGKDIAAVSIIGVITCAVQIIVMLCTVIPTEIALKKNFDECGNRLNS